MADDRWEEVAGIWKEMNIYAKVVFDPMMQEIIVWGGGGPKTSKASTQMFVFNVQKNCWRTSKSGSQKPIDWKYINKRFYIYEIYYDNFLQKVVRIGGIHQAHEAVVMKNLKDKCGNPEIWDGLN